MGCMFSVLLNMALAFETVEEGKAVVMVLLLQLFRFTLVIVQV